MIGRVEWLESISCIFKILLFGVEPMDEVAKNQTFSTSMVFVLSCNIIATRLIFSKLVTLKLGGCFP